MTEPNGRVAQLPGQMAALEDELRTAVHGQDNRMSFQTKGKRVEFLARTQGQL